MSQNRTGTGNKSGFTFLEVMLTTVVLSLGSLLIYEVLLRSLDLINYCDDYLNVVSSVEERLWEAQDELGRFGTLAKTAQSGALTFRNKNFNWGISYGAVDEAEDLYRIDVILSWRGNRRDTMISRTAYAVRYAKEG